MEGVLYYLVKWDGFPDSDNTLEPAEDLFDGQNGRQKIKEYKRQTGKKSIKNEAKVEKEFPVSQGREVGSTLNTRLRLK